MLSFSLRTVKVFLLFEIWCINEVAGQTSGCSQNILIERSEIIVVLGSYEELIVFFLSKKQLLFPKYMVLTQMRMCEARRLALRGEQMISLSL